MTTAPPANSALRNPWVIGWLALVITVLCVNSFMVYLAISTNPGLVNPAYYDRGQHYEQTLVSRRVRDPNWTIRADIPKPLQVGAAESIRVFLVDRAGQPIDPESVTFYAYRPSKATQDFSLPMTREDRGRYLVKTAFPLIGVWDVLIAAKSADDEYSLSERVNVQGR